MKTRNGRFILDVVAQRGFHLARKMALVPRLANASGYSEVHIIELSWPCRIGGSLDRIKGPKAIKELTECLKESALVGTTLLARG